MQSYISKSMQSYIVIGEGFMEYYPRVFDKILEEYLEIVGAVVIVGPKWCGKTTTATRYAKSVLKLENQDNRKSHMLLADIKPSVLLEGEKPRLIDEWKIAPVMWDAVRTSVDKLSGYGLYILTSSTSVDNSKIMHTGTGRFVRLIMMPMSLFESKESNGKISIIDLFNNPNLNIDGIKSDLTIEGLIFAACRGGWPDSLNRKTKKDQLAVPYNYLRNIYENDISTIDGVKRDSKKVKSFLKAYARNISTIVKNTTLINDIKTNYSNITPNTFYNYRNVLERLFVISNINSWNPNIRSKTSIKSISKKEFIDPSIAVAALNLNPKRLLHDLDTFEPIFENLCIRDLTVYTSHYGGEISYYSDKLGLEVDCVIHLRDGRYCLIEFKLASFEIDSGAENLLKLKELIQKKGLKEPSFLAVVTGGEFAYTREDGVKVIPISVLR